MQKAIRQLLAGLGGRTACVVLLLDNVAAKELVSINADMLFPAASLAKIPIMIEAARQVSLGMLSWDARYPIAEQSRVFSDGVLADLSADLRPTLHDLTHMMITISDNTAANVVLDLVGMDAVNVTMQQLGLALTRVERHFIDYVARRAGRENWTTAGDMALLLSYFCMELLPEREQMLAMLLHQNDRTILPAYWGEDIPFAHKTGGLEGIIHDAGIFYPPQSGGTSVIIVVMTAEQVDEPLTRYTLSRLGKIIYDEWENA
ncbi:MAG TPA: serine hydrolase [Ktedonobacteraceae bacterium]